MFFQVSVPKKDRFLWWRDGNPNDDILEYQMTRIWRHLISQRCQLRAESGWDYGIRSYSGPDVTEERSYGGPDVTEKRSYGGPDVTEERFYGGPDVTEERLCGRLSALS